MLCLSFSLSAFGQTKKKDIEQTYVMAQPYEVQKITPQKQKKRPKNVIIMIGDGMSLMHVYSAWTANRGKLFLENSQYTGLSKTYCLDRLITDSGAGGTAISTGQKAMYRAVGVDPTGKPLTTLFDLAARKGKSTGVAVTCHICDATPADFCAHNLNRNDIDSIATDYVDCGVDFLFGGGAQAFTQRKDGRNLLSEMRARGYQTPGSIDELEQIQQGKVVALPYLTDAPKPAERGDLLARAALKGIELLNQNRKGFAMMIEGSLIDDYGHSNELDLLMQEVHDFDRTVGKIFEWAANDGETLVVITADHETGGLTLVGGDKNEGRIVGKFSTIGHSGVMVPVYAFGPGADEFTGIFENADIFAKIKKVMGL